MPYSCCSLRLPSSGSALSLLSIPSQEPSSKLACRLLECIQLLMDGRTDDIVSHSATIGNKNHKNSLTEALEGAENTLLRFIVITIYKLDDNFCIVTRFLHLNSLPCFAEFP